MAARAPGGWIRGPAPPGCAFWYAVHRPVVAGEASQREAVSPPRALAGSEPGAMDTAMDMYYTLRDMRKRQLAHQVLNLAMIVCSALMIWKSLMVITESDSPVVVVLRCSHRPLPARTPWRCDAHAVHSDPRRGSLTVGAWSRRSTEATSYSCTWASHPSVPATSWSSRWPIVRFRSCTASSRCASCSGLVHRLQPQAARARRRHAAPRPVQTRARRAASGAREGERRGGHIDQGR